MTEQEINNLIDSKIGKTKMSQLPEATQTSGLYSIGYTGNQSVKYKANLLQGDPLTVRKTYQTEAEALADKNPIDTATSLPLTVGQFVSIVDDGEKNGIYRIGSISGDGTMSLELQGKLGDLSEYLKETDLEPYTKTDDVVGDLFHIKGKYISADYGTEGSSSLVNRTDYIPFKRDSGVTVKGRGHPNVALIAFYDVNRVFISSISGSEYHNILTTFDPSDIPEDAKYIIASCNADVGGVLDVVTFSSIIDELNINHENVESVSKESKLYVNKMIGSVFSLPNTYINGQGLATPIEGAVSTDFIFFDKNAPIKVKGRNTETSNLLSFYDINGEYISGYGGDASLTTMTVEPADFPIDAVTIRASGTVGAENILECGFVIGNSEQLSRLGDRIHNIYGNPFVENNSFVKKDGTITSPFENASITGLISFDPSVAIKVKGRSNYLIALIAFYDIDNKFISSLYGDEYDDKIITILPSEIPTNAFSLRATCRTDKGGILEYGALGVINRYITKINDNLNDRINTLKGDYFSIKDSYIRQDTGVQTEFEGVRCTPFIRINSDAVIKVKGRSNNATALIAFYDKDKKHISSIFGSDNNNVLKTINPVDIPTEALYIRCSVTEGYEGVLETEIIPGILEELQIRQPAEEPTEPEEPIVVSSGSYVNVTELYPIVGYHTKSSARSAIPPAERHSGIVLSYAISENNWIRETFISKDLSQWVRDSLWKRLDNDDVTDFIETVDGDEMLYTGDEFGNKKLVSIKDLQKYFIDSQNGFPKPEDTLFYPSHIDLIDNKWVDKSGNENDADLVQSYCGNAKVGNIMKFANSLQGSISDWTMTSDGTAVATLAIDGIRFTQGGTIYNIRLTNNVLDKEHFYPVSEGTMAVYDCSGNSNHISLLSTDFLEWIGGRQDDFHYNLKKGGGLKDSSKMLPNPTLTGAYVDGLAPQWTKHLTDSVSEETSITINGQAQRVASTGGGVNSRILNVKYKKGDVIKVTAQVYPIKGSSYCVVLATNGGRETYKEVADKIGEWQTIVSHSVMMEDNEVGSSIYSRANEANSEWIIGDVKTEVISTKVRVPALENGLFDALGRVIEVSPKSMFKVETGIKFTPNNQLIEADVDNLLFDNLGSPNTVVVSDVNFAIENMLYENRIFANCDTSDFLIFSDNLDKTKTKSLLDKWGKSPIHIYRNPLEYLPIGKNETIDVLDINRNFRVGKNRLDKLFVSNDYGKTWSDGFDYRRADGIHHIFITSKGSVIIFYFKSIVERKAWGEDTFTRIYPVDESGVPIVMHTPINPEWTGEYYKPYHKLLDIYDASDNSSLIAWGTWNNNAGSNGAAPQALFYSTDDCATIKRFYYFGQNPRYSDKGTSDASGGAGTLLGDPDNPMYCRHIHELSLNKYTGKIYASCGDSSTRPEMHFLELEYNKETDTWSEPIDLIADATRNQIHRFIGVGFDKDGYMYFGSDADFIPYTENGVTYDTQGVFKVHIDNINDITKYELIHEARDIVVNSFMYDDIFIYSLQGHEHIVFVSRDKGTTWNRIDTSEYFTDDYPHNLTMIDGRKRIASYIIDDRGNVLAKGGKGIYMNILGK